MDFKLKNPLRFYSYAAIVVCAVIPIFMAIIVFLSLALNNFDGQRTYYFGYKPTFILTGSMEPVVKVNGMVILKDCSMDEVEVGDIVRYHNGKIFVLHRVISKTEEDGGTYLITKGDANKVEDNFRIYEEDLLGKVVGIHNWTRDFMTLFFGEFNVRNIFGSLINIGLGILKLTALVVIVLLLGVWLFEVVSINYFFYRKPETMQEAIDWMDDRTRKADFNNIVDSYHKALKNANIIQKIIILAQFRKYYDVLCSEESKAKKAHSKLRKLEKTIKKVELSNNSTKAV